VPAVFQTAPETVQTLPSSVAVLSRSFVTLRKGAGPRAPSLDHGLLVRHGVTLERERIAKYAAVCGFSPAHGVPLTYPHVLAFPLHMLALTRSSFPYPVVGLVHLENVIRQRAPLCDGQTVSISVRLADWLAHEKGQAFTIETAIARGDTPVWDSVSTYLRIGVKDPQGAPYQGLPADETQLDLGEKWVLRADLGRRYARVSGDYNPIHLSAATAKLLGFPRAIAHGMWTKARALAAALPPQPLGTAEVRVAFKTPAFLPGTARYSSAGTSAGMLFEVRDGKGEKPFLRGLLHATPLASPAV